MKLPAKVDGIYRHDADCDCDLCRYEYHYRSAKTKRRPDVNESSVSQRQQPASERNE